MNDIQSLQRLGLKKDVASIYYALLSKPHLTIADIARNTGLQRTTIYRSLPQLTELELVFTSKQGKRTVYQAAPPSSLKDLANNITLQMQDLVPRLERRVEEGLGKPLVTIRQGTRAVKDALMDIVTTLPKGGVFYRYRPSRVTSQQFVPKAYHELKKEKDIQRYWITHDELDPSLHKELNRAIRTVAPNTSFNFPLNQYIYGNKVSYIDFDSKTAIIIEHAGIAAFQRQTFLLLFKLLPSKN